MLLIKAKNLTEGNKVNSIVSTLSHPMYLISVILVEIGGMELRWNLYVLVVPKGHDASQSKVLTCLDCPIEVRIILCSQLLPVNVLHLHNLGLLAVEDD